MKTIDLAIIGSGPAGYTAAIYASRAMLQPYLYTGTEIGGQLMYTTDIENFPGFPQGINGSGLMQQLQQQASKFGTKVVFETISAVDFSSQPFKLWSGFPDQAMATEFTCASHQRYASLAKKIKQSPATIQAKAVIISTGATAIMLNIPEEKKLLGKGVSTCAVCDAAFFKQKKVYVVGGGDCAMEDSLALARFSDQVTIIHRRDSFRASKIMQQRVLNNKNIKVLWNSEVVAIRGEQKLETITIKTKDELQEVKADGLFLAIGHQPVTTIFKDQISLDEKGYIVTAMSHSTQGCQLAQARLDSQGLITLPSMTSVPGVFAAGDVVDLRYKQAITSAGLGAGAALDAEAWLNLF